MYLLKAYCSVFIFFCFFPSAHSQNSFFLKKDSLYTFIQPFAQIQTFATFTMNEKADLDNNGTLERVDNRFDVFFRRARIGFRGEPYKNLRYFLSLFYDNLGRDEFNGVRGQSNDNRVFGVFDAFLQWRMTRKNDLFHLTFGFFRPQISRESITSAWATTSFEKIFTQNYTRIFLINRSTGRATGLNLGGLYHKEKFGINYNLGFFTSNDTGTDPLTRGNSTGAKWSPVWVGRMAFTLGDAEMERYGISYQINYFNQRKGLTLAFAASRQGATDVFVSGNIQSIDLLFNYSFFNLDGEFSWMQRKKDDQIYRFSVGHIRAGVNIPIARKYILEPLAAFALYRGNDRAADVRFFDGEDKLYDFGANLYLDKLNLKINLHYTIQQGKGSNNLFLRQNNRNVEKGDYLGLGFLAII